MNKTGQINLAAILMIFIGVIFAVALLNPIAQIQNKMVAKQVTSNQSNDVASAYLTNITVNTTLDLPIYTQSNWKTQKCPLTLVALRNGAGTTLTSGTDYALNASEGTYTLLNTANTQPATSLNQTYADYTYCADGYNTDNASRSMASLILLFAVLALLAFVLEKSNFFESLKF